MQVRYIIRDMIKLIKQRGLAHGDYLDGHLRVCTLGAARQVVFGHPLDCPFWDDTKFNTYQKVKAKISRELKLRDNLDIPAWNDTHTQDEVLSSLRKMAW